MKSEPGLSCREVLTNGRGTSGHGIQVALKCSTFPAASKENQETVLPIIHLKGVTTTDMGTFFSRAVVFRQSVGDCALVLTGGLGGPVVPE